MESLEDESSDITVQYQGGAYDIATLQSIASRMFSYLFFIELISIPFFYSTPDRAKVRLKCRLSPGPPLMSLIMDLQRRNAQIRYRGHEGSYSMDKLVTSAVISRCRKGRDFSRILEMEVSSLSSVLDVRIYGTALTDENISNCPYELQKLIQDQGLDCVFGRKDCGARQSEASEILGEEIDRLREILDDVLVKQKGQALV
jgi:hypothetical protein